MIPEKNTGPLNDSLVSLIDSLPGLIFTGLSNDQRALTSWHGHFPAVVDALERAAAAGEVLSWESIIHPSDLQEVRHELDLAFSSQRPYRLIYRLVHSPQSELWVLERGQFDPLGRRVGFLIDHTDRMMTLNQRERKRAILDERNRMARDLHDTIAQALYSIALFAEAGKAMFRQNRGEFASQSIDQILEIAQQAQKDIRILVHNLRQSQVAEVGLVQAIQNRLAGIEGRAGLKYDLKVDVLPNLAPELEDAIYLIIHELLTNSFKHARADHVTVVLGSNDEGNQLECIVQDNGRGFIVKDGFQSGGVGLASIRERVALLNGTIALDSVPGTGTTARIEVPIKTAS